MINAIIALYILIPTFTKSWEINLVSWVYPEFESISSYWIFHAKFSDEVANVTVVSTSSGLAESEATARKRTNSLNDSEEGSPEPGSQSPTHTPPLTPALTPQREDTPAPENLSLRKSGSPPQTQQTLQPVDLVQPRPSPPLPPLAVSFPALALTIRLIVNEIWKYDSVSALRHETWHCCTSFI